MPDIRRGFGVAALTAAAVLGGLAIPATAHADEVAAVQITVCNDSDVSLQFWVKGYNQFDDWDDSPVWRANAHTCATGWNYWWKKNSSVELHYKRGSAGWTWKQEYVPKTGAKTVTFRVS
ncbi:hypothetical protein ABZ896_12930 [Streptomyces sp. NPDC047072]|uniref:hypothetical protein n=1 Tax=Streptomyces sp. NPDC047072 TaxID=3154809 RepID=UPI0034064077